MRRTSFSDVASAITIWFFLAAVTVQAAPDESPKPQVASGAAGLTADVRHRSAPPALMEERPIKYASQGFLGGRASVFATKRLAEAGEPLILEIRFQCDGGSEDIYDPFLCTGDPERAELRVFDEAGTFVGNALVPVEYTDEARERWLTTRVGTIIGRSVRLETGDKTMFAAERADKRDPLPLALLGQGKYLIQFVLCGRFRDWHRNRNYAPVTTVLTPSQELCYSNVLHIQVLPRGVGGNERIQRDGNLHATILVDNPIIQIHELFDYTSEVQNVSSKSITILDPRYSLMPHERSELVLHDSGGRRLANLTPQGRRQNGSHGGFVEADYWIKLPPGAILGEKRQARLWANAGGKPLQPGAYRLQMTFLDTFVSENPYAGLPDPDNVTLGQMDPRFVERRMKWNNEHPGKELFRSNAVDVIVAEGR